MIRKVFRTGNSYCITLPKRVLKDTGIEYSEWVVVEPSKNKKEIIIRKKTDNDW